MASGADSFYIRDIEIRIVIILLLLWSFQVLRTRRKHVARV